MIKDQILRLCWRSVLLSSLLYFTVLPESVSSGPAWLSGLWDKRVKITINSTNINATLTNFPVLIHLSTNSGENAEDVSFVFDELGSDTNRKKIAVTTSNGTDQCYVEIEEWIHTNEQAWLWVKVPNVASNADTDLYIYYDKDRPDNTNYVGDPNSTPAENVWDTNFTLVTHMQDNPDAFHVLDSTSKNNDGTKAGTNDPQQVNSKFGKAQDFDGTNDYISLTDNPLDMDTGDFTTECWIKAPAADNFGRHTVAKDIDGSPRWYGPVMMELTGEVRAYISDNVNTYYSTSANNVDDNEWHHIVCVFDRDVKIRIFIDGNEETVTEVGTITNVGSLDNTEICRIGFSTRGTISRVMEGAVDEVRISKNTARSPAWIKASYETQRDHLLDFGVEENRRIPGTVMFIM